MLYRALDNLSIGVRRFEVFDARRLSEKTLALLEQRGFIAPVKALPLAVIPEWEERLDVLDEAGIETLSDVVLFPGVPAGVEATTWAIWQAEAVDSLTIKCATCRR